MENHPAEPILRAFADALHHTCDPSLVQQHHTAQTHQHPVASLIDDLVDAGKQVSLIFTQNNLPREKVDELIAYPSFPMLIFLEEEGEAVPTLLYTNKKDERIIRQFKQGQMLTDVEISQRPAYFTEEGSDEVVLVTGFPFSSMMSDNHNGKGKEVSPVKRLLRLLGTEKQDILYIYVYAIAVGIISLSLPLGTQAIVGFISGGMWFNSVVLLISLVVIGVLVSGGLQIMQIAMVEVLQRRIFAKAAFEFAYRTPKLDMEALFKYYAPELMNRFFDILTLQKGLPKLLIDLSTAALQIFFSLVLLSFYHPFFVFFGLLLITILILIFYITGPKGLKSSIVESKYKYKVVFWLEELARTIYSFKVAGNTHLPMKVADYNVNNYLAHRRMHFSVLIRQFSYIVIFKTLIIAGLLILGTLLVINRQITLGQFVASEIIIVLILGAVEKIIINMDTVYDMLTAVDKIGHVTDLPLERQGGFDAAQHNFREGIDIKLSNVNYTFPESDIKALKNINLHIKQGEHICVAGYHNSGKTTLVNLLDGIYASYKGSITYNGISLKNIDLSTLRDHIGKNVSQEDIFDGTVLDNIMLGKPQADPKVALRALSEVDALDEINKLPDGVHTHLLPGGKMLSAGIVSKIILARCVAKQPKVIILNDYFQVFEKSEKKKLMQYLTDQKHAWTLIVVSNDPVVMQACQRVLVMKDGSIVSDGSTEHLAQDVHFNEVVF